MTRKNRLTFVVPIALICLGALAPTAALAQGWYQQVAMWHPQQWPSYQPATPEEYWGAHRQAAPPEAQPVEPERRDAARTQRGAAKAGEQKAGRSTARTAKAKAPRNRGIASWYGKRFHGRKTASGQRFDMHAMTAAHRSLPLPSYVRVSNPANGASVVVLVNDRGPYVRNRIIDLSYAAASALGITKRGTAMVDLEVIPNPLPALAAATQTSPAEGMEGPAAATAID
jgi:rare lipoprotein A